MFGDEETQTIGRLQRMVLVDNLKFRLSITAFNYTAMTSDLCDCHVPIAEPTATQDAANDGLPKMSGLKSGFYAGLTEK
jgi:hypothetical protein